MKTRDKWTALGGQWQYNRDSYGLNDGCVIQYVKCGKKMFEAHYFSNEGKCGSFGSKGWSEKQFTDKLVAMEFVENHPVVRQV